VFSSDGTDLFSDAFYDQILTSSRLYQPLYSEDSTQFVGCANDRHSLEERIDFCKGSASALSGRASVLGLRAAGRTDISQVCNIALRQCLIYPDDPGGWTFAKVVDALKSRQSAEPYTLIFVPVSFKVVVNIPIFGTSVATTFYNSPQMAGADAYAEAAAVEPVFEDINVTWSASEELVQGVCPPGGPRVSQQAKVFGLLWAIVEGMSGDGKTYSIISFDGLASDPTSQRTKYTRAQVYPPVKESEIKTGLQKFVIRSAFNADASAVATAARPQLAKRFSPINIVFSGDPPAGAASCARFLTEAELTLSGVEFKQDTPACKTFPQGDRAPVIATGQSVANTLFHYTTCTGCPAHGLVAKGYDTSVYTNRVAENVDVGGVAMVGASLRLAWPEEECSDKAMACSALDTFSGIALALARTQGTAEVVSCPATQTNGRCYAENEREPTFMLYANEKDKPMYSWYANKRPTRCDNANQNFFSGIKCFQGYFWRHFGSQYVGTSLIDSTEGSSNFPKIDDTRIRKNTNCTEERTAPVGGSATQSVPVRSLKTIDEMYLEDKTASSLVPPWFGWYGSTNVIGGGSTTVTWLVNASIGSNVTASGGLTLLVNHSFVEKQPRPLRKGDRVTLANQIYFVFDYVFPVAAGDAGKLQLMDNINSTSPHVFQIGDHLNGSSIEGMRKDELEPCSPENFVIFSDGAVFQGDTAIEDAANYGLISELTHKCSAVGCLGGVNSTYTIPRCNTAFPMNYTADGGRYFMWHGILVDPSQEIFGLRQDGLPGKVGLGMKVHSAASGDDDDVLAGTSMRMLEFIGGQNQNMCVERSGQNLTAGACTQITNPNMQWLLVADGPFFRVEVPGDPYSCISVSGNYVGPVMAPCPPCMVGSGSFVVGLPDADPADMPKILQSVAIEKTDTAVSDDGMLHIPLSLTNNRLYFMVHPQSGLCNCAASNGITTIAHNHSCPCSLSKITKQQVKEATGDPDICTHAVGPLLAACDKFGGGLAAVDGYKTNMIEACRILEVNSTRRFSGEAEGRGATFVCNAQRNMVHVTDPGDYFVDGEAIEGLPGLTAIVSKVMLQPYETAIPSVVVAPYSLEINVSDFLTPFGGTLHQLALQSFSTEASVWAGVIAELSIITAVVLLQVCLLAKSPLKVETAMTNAKIKMDEKKNR